MLKKTIFSSSSARAIVVLGLSLLWTARAQDFGVPFEENEEDEVLSRSPRQTNFEEQCSFETLGDTISTCDLITDVKRFEVVDWTTGKGENSVWQGGPPTDASNSPDGGYGIIEMSQMSDMNGKGQQAWLLTKQTPSTGPDGRCISFNFATDGLSFGTLELYLIRFEDEVDFANETKPNFDRLRIWFERDPTMGEWMNSSATYTATGFHSLAFVAMNDMEYLKHPGYAAIDNIAIAPGPCEFDCHFDKNLCSFKNSDDSAGSGWVLRRGGDKRGTGPAGAHTYSTDNRFTPGSCAIFDSAYPRRPGDSAKLVSQTIEGRNEPICLSFWASMYGRGIGSLSVDYTVISTNETTTVWKREGSFNTDRWIQCRISVSSAEDFFVSFVGVIGEPESGDIALDTISFTPGECPSLPPGIKGSISGDCTFSSSSCDWKVENYENPSNPFLDIVAGGGQNKDGHKDHSHSVYNLPDMYAKFDLSSYRNRPRQTSALINRVPKPGFYCLSFWIFMFATIPTENKIGTLRVIVGGERNITVWSLTNQQHSKWEKVKVPFRVNEGDFVAIEATKGKNLPGGMIGVDDITFYQGVCDILPAAASVTLLDCYFDKDRCGWTVRNPNQDDRTLSNWLLGKNTLINMRDKTYGVDKGGFMMMESYSLAIRSQLVSTSITANEAYCLTFYFGQYYEDSDAKLTVALRDLNTNDLTTVWELNKASVTQTAFLRNFEWVFAQVALPASSSPQQVIIEGRVKRSGLTIDNIRLYPGIENCKKHPTYV
ncbi:MAM and LDL-receptor class A domain-containing protein 1-like [Oratosquilla oratoria]|uniref:MAM and LDL-receptor class A domain-containing protein 1-like n=1 Tax=Oratosquilla oratoria TaxID=337810 RepID=UPI003F757FAC